MQKPRPVPAKLLPALVLAVALGGLSAVPAHAETLFAQGVSIESGWYDANKAFAPGATIGGSYSTMVKGSSDYYANSDSELCWAAAASNMLQWWQDRYAETFGALPAGTPNGKAAETLYDDRRQYQIFNVFADNWTNKSGYPSSGIAWWLEGANPSAGASTVRTDATVSGGFFSDAIAAGAIASADECLSYLKYSVTESFPQDFSADMLDFFDDGLSVLDLGVRLSDTGTLHGITCWGVNVDENDLVTAIYYTDSDDNYSNLLLSDTAVNALATQGYLTKGGEFLQHAEISYTEDGSVQFAMAGGVTATIEDRTALTFMALIPEPSAFGVLAGAAALLLAGTRRRRQIF